MLEIGALQVAFSHTSDLSSSEFTVSMLFIVALHVSKKLNDFQLSLCAVDGAFD